MRDAVFGRKTKTNSFSTYPFFFLICMLCEVYALFWGGKMFLPFFLLNMRMLSRRVIIRNTHTHTYKGEKHAFSRSYSCPLSYILVPFWPVYNNIDEITNDGPIYRSKLLVFFICPWFPRWRQRPYVNENKRTWGVIRGWAAARALRSSHSRVSCGENSIVTVLYNSVVTGGERFTAYR